MSRIQANLVLLLAAAIWGGGFVAQATAMQAMGPLWFVSVRFFVATAVVLPFALMESARASRPLSGRDRMVFIATGLALFGGATVQQLGLMTTTVTNASFLTGLYVVFVPVISLIFLRRPPHWVIWPAALLALAGIYLLGGGDLGSLNGGDALIVICALFWSAQIILAGYAAHSTGRVLTLSVWQFAVTAVVGMMVAAATEPFHFEALSGAMTEILYAGTMSSGLAFVLQIFGQRYTTAPQAAIFLATEALFGALFGALLLGESLHMPGYVGCGLLFIAIVMVEIVPELVRKRRAQGSPLSEPV